MPSTTPAIESIIFDLGRVIVKLEPLRALAAINASQMARGRRPVAQSSNSAAVTSNLPAEKMWAAIQKDPLWPAWQEGRLTPKQWYENLTTRFHVRITFKKFRDAWDSVIVPEPDLLLPDSLLAQLSKRCRLVALSNTDPLHVQHLESHFRFMRHFSARIYSCAVGASKPSRTIFLAAMVAANTPPKRILFIDDIHEYILVARSMGMHAFQFRSRPRLESALSKLGLCP
jgi:HAD superfamily hydrolase (TIGR01509 family)